MKCKNQVYVCLTREKESPSLSKEEEKREGINRRKSVRKESEIEVGIDWPGNFLLADERWPKVSGLCTTSSHETMREREEEKEN